MPALKIAAFTGEIPRAEPRLLPQSGAQQAVNCNLLSGGLRPEKATLRTDTLAKAGRIRTISRYRYVDQTYQTEQVLWLQWNEDVDVVRTPIAGDTLGLTIFTGTDAPRIFDGSMANVAGGNSEYPESSYLLGLPAPTTAPTAALGAGGSGTARDLTYVYTFVRKWTQNVGGTPVVIKVDESAPSPVSNMVNALPGQAVDLSGFDNAPSADYGITHIYIYRIEVSNAGAEYQFVDEVAIGTTAYTDTKLDTDLGEVLESTYWTPPPAELRGLVTLPSGAVAGFKGNEVYISVPYQLHAWPDSQRYTVPDQIVALGTIGNTIVVTTQNLVYLLTGIDPQAMSQSIIYERLPCVSKRGLVSNEKGVFYPSAEGLAWIAPAGRAEVITRKIMDPDDWRTLKPETIHAVSWNGRYIAFYENGLINGVMTGGGFLIDLNEGASDIIRYGFYADAAHVDPVDGRLYLVEGDGGSNLVTEWAGSPELLSFLWRSKEFIASEALNLAAGQVIGEFDRALTADETAALEAQQAAETAANQATIDAGGIIAEIPGETEINELAINGDNLIDVVQFQATPAGVVVRVFADGEQISEKLVNSDKPFRLPGGKLYRRIEIELEGAVPVREIRVGTSIQELVNA